MAGKSARTDKDRSLDFQGFLSKLDGWDGLLQEKSTEMGTSSNTSKDQGDKSISKKAPEKTLNYKYPSFSDEEVIPDANSEKELGNEYFKQKKFNEAIDCYSRSIALSPTAVAFANRAMAYIRLKRYEEAESDCTEALNLDDRYIKAYSRRSTARKELGKLKEAMDDAEFAVSLEPNTQELRKQYDDIKALYLKEMQKAASLLTKTSEIQKNITSVTGSDARTHSSPIISVKDEFKDTNKIIQTSTGSRNKTKTEIQDLASRAISHFTSNHKNNIIVPKSAYEFEVSWRALSEDPSQQALLLKIIEPSSLPQIFKNALSPSFLVDIIKCTATFFREEIELAMNILDNLSKVPRFDMISMCLPPPDHTELKQIWNEVFSQECISASQSEIMTRLRRKYLHDK